MLRIVLAIALLVSSLHAGAGGFPRPASLEPAVQFWIRVYTEITTNQGYIHDAVDMGVIYETLELPKYASNRKRDELVKDAKARVARAPAVFCTVPEMHGLMNEPPMPISNRPLTTGTQSRQPAVISSEMVGASSLPPNQTGVPIRP